MDSKYDFSSFEDTIYKQWETAGTFEPQLRELNVESGMMDRKKPTPHNPQPTFTIIMPPPNANDPLHVGHAMFVALEDIMIRYHRMLGDASLWLPGTDHAGIETQFVFEKKLQKQGKSRFNFDRETLYKMIWDDVQENSNIAVDQMKKMGASADWSRFKFMLDPDIVSLVLDTFDRMHKEKLIYRGFRLVNYCPKCGTSFSELEVNHVERNDPMYYMKYGPFTVATVRPETKFRDTALAANPNDPRYKEYIGQTMEIPGLLGPIKMTVIADEEVDMDFGTGIMKVTPAHDPHDFELGQKYNLPVTPIITTQGRMDFSWFLERNNIEPKYRERAERYHNMKVAAFRQEMVKDLEAEGLLERVDEKYVHTVNVCYRCGTLLEPLPMPQFFVTVKPLVEPVLRGLDNGEITVLGAGREKILRHWLENLKDWNISRQIVWGIRIPVWYEVTKNPTMEVTFLNTDGERVTTTIKHALEEFSLEHVAEKLQSIKVPMEAEFTVSKTKPGENYLQETDTFDTWFSSGQWPYTTLQTTKAGDFERFYPTQVMETGYDILPAWVVRMLFMGKYATNKFPFSTIYLHGLVRDAKGKKMSKSKGNVINPLEVIEKYGADALRMALVIRSTPGLDKSVGDADFKAARNLTNKLWNAARFILLSTGNLTQDQPSSIPRTNDHEQQAENQRQSTRKNGDSLQLNVDDAFNIKLESIVNEVSANLNNYQLGLAADTLYNEFWHWYCDECIESYKNGSLSQEDLCNGLITFLKLLHPFMPFVTEAIWQELVKVKLVNEDLLITASWPNNS